MRSLFKKKGGFTEGLKPDGDAKNDGKSYVQNGIMQGLRSLRKRLPEAFIIY